MTTHTLPELHGLIDGMTHRHADPELPPGFKRADHKPMLPGGIPVTDQDGNPGELMPVSMGAMPPELALMLLMAMMSAGRGPKN